VEKDEPRSRAWLSKYRGCFCGSETIGGDGTRGILFEEKYSSVVLHLWGILRDNVANLLLKLIDQVLKILGRREKRDKNSIVGEVTTPSRCHFLLERGTGLR
jgi:hypothetical protein